MKRTPRVGRCGGLRGGGQNPEAGWPFRAGWPGQFSEMRIQLRYEPRARQIHDQARAHGLTRREAMRVLKRHLSDAIYRTMLRDARQAGT